MTQTSYSSKDFAIVPDTLTAAAPERLVQRDVLGSAATDFSRARRHAVGVVDLPSRTISMTLGGLEPGQSTRLHRHSYETLIYVVRGAGHSVIGDARITWRGGDAFYVPTWAWHQHCNDSDSDDALYVACENAPLLQNLGVALREEQ